MSDTPLVLVDWRVVLLDELDAPGEPPEREVIGRG